MFRTKRNIPETLFRLQYTHPPDAKLNDAAEKDPLDELKTL